ncbi:MAG TPA: hypothetical protein VJM32_05515 [Candidatus Saccharimonadales bacterium]|nr:hypothetical protein [Candidatus Saccharimonadales bacterium]
MEQQTLTIRLFNGNRTGELSALFVNSEERGTRRYAEFRSFAAVPEATISKSGWCEVEVVVPDNSFRLGVDSGQPEPGNMVEIVATGNRVRVCGHSFALVRDAFHAFLEGLGQHLAEQELHRATLAARSGQDYFG